jgi:ABC-2 type transport system ATP-binding protein
MLTAIHPARETLRQLTAIRRRCQMPAKLGAGRAVASGPALEVRGLQKRYGERVGVRDVSFSVARGEIFGILGPNGAGKTTTVECAQGLRNADAGVIRVLGLDSQRDTAALWGRIGSQLQDSALPDRLKVWEALDLFGSLTPGGSDWPALLERWGLAHKRNASFADLSGGERQRLFVALALIGSREIVFLDELTQGLDPAARRVAWGMIREIRDRGCTVVLVTHDLDEAEKLCDRLAVIDQGRVVATGTAQELIARSRSGVCVRFSTDRADVSWLRTIDGVREVVHRGRQVEVHGSGALLALVASALVEHGIAPADLRVAQPTLEDAYVQLTSATVRERD